MRRKEKKSISLLSGGEKDIPVWNGCRRRCLWFTNYFEKKGDRWRRIDSIYERALHRRANDYPENIAYHRFLHLYFFYNCIIFDSRWENLDVSVAGVIDLLLLYYSGVYWYDQLEVQDKLYKKDFLKKMRTVEFKEITKVEQHKSIIEKEYIIIYVKGEKPIKIDRYNENVEVLLMRLKDEKISVMWLINNVED